MKTYLTAKEYTSLDPKTRAKYRKLIKEYEAQLNPVRSTKIKLEEELRREAYTALDIEERVKEAESPIREEMERVNEQLRELNAKWRELADQLSNVASEIRVEHYRVAYSDPQVQALGAIWENINQTHAKNLADLIESTQKVEVA